MASTPQPTRLRRLARTLYDTTIRDRLPRRLGVLNGIVARSPRLLDATDRDPTYKHALISAIRTHVTPGDHVINIGGGVGVSTVAAATQAETSGRVICYEAAREYVRLCREATRLNNVAARVDVQHAVVGDDLDVWGACGDPIAPDSLPQVDCLVLDCEGAEHSILSELAQRPRVVIVEVHPENGVSLTAIRDLLAGRGYDTTVDETNSVGPYDTTGTPVITALRDESSARTDDGH